MGAGRTPARGNVAATARDLTTLDDLVGVFGDRFLPLLLDVTDRDGDFAAVATAREHFGVLDVVINNAGYGQFGMIEEVSEQEVRDQLEMNVFGAFWITQAALPIMRKQSSSHIIQVSSIGGISAFTDVGVYHASKCALEGFSRSLAQEVAEFGIRVTLIEPGGFSTNWTEAPSMRRRCRRTTLYGNAVLLSAAARPRVIPTHRPRRSHGSWMPMSRPCACSSAPRR